MPFSPLSLPPTLLQYTFLRIPAIPPARLTSARLHLERVSTSRHMHQLASLDASNMGDIMDNTQKELSRLKMYKASQHNSPVVKSPRSSSKKVVFLNELDRRVRELGDVIGTQEFDFEPLFYTEEYLISVYQDVLAVTSPRELEYNDQTDAIQKGLDGEDATIVNSLESRIFFQDMAKHESIPLYHRILNRTHEILHRAAATRDRITNDNLIENYIPLGILTLRELEALVRTSINKSDIAATEIALDIAKMANLPLDDKYLTNILKQYAEAGNVKRAEETLRNYQKESPTEFQRHLHVQAHLNATPLRSLPKSSLDVLHQYEIQNIPAPMSAYTLVIEALLTISSSLSRAHAWDLFTHMRYVAHPNPDEYLYTLMIRACASPVSVIHSSEPERALDLWTEMTVDQKIEPTLGSYNAIIFACARSGKKSYVNEAFRLARQMFNSHRDSRGTSAFLPDRNTFCALLEGAKRIGDLGRARWILIEMVQDGQHETNRQKAIIDEEIMMHIFNTYAAYNPPLSRMSTVLIGGDTNSPTAHGNSQSGSSNLSLSSDVVVTTDGPDNLSDDAIALDDEPVSFSSTLPQSRAEVIREAKILFNHILRDRNKSTPLSLRKFRSVNLTPRLLGSYLSVFYRHASLEISRKLFWKIFDDLKLSKTPRIYIEALERCANARRGPDRKNALFFAEEVWEKWIELEDSHLAQQKPLSPRMVERAHIAMIRMLAISDKVDKAMEFLRTFAAKYPPNAIRIPSPKLPMRSTRTALVGKRPLVRITSTTEVPDDNVPPFVMFQNIEVLHHRLVFFEKASDIGYITWLCKAYEWALRARKDDSVKAKVVD